MPITDELWRLIGSIPKGRVASYGALGQALSTPCSGFLVGRWLAGCPADVPWWRVVAKDGRLPVWKRGAEVEREQIERLAREAVEVVEGRVAMDRYEWLP
ncbi:MAG TPA: MGMT family protein [Fimbriimonas sp.]|nr:MGMT family protein [Fimbriimonas sp.]